MSVLSGRLANAVTQVERAQRRLEQDQERAEEMLTQLIEEQARELVKRFPKRQIKATSGMGSLSIEISGNTNPESPDHHPDRPWLWIWGVGCYQPHCKPFKALCDEWDSLFDEVAERIGLEYINFTRDVIVNGPNYNGK